MQLIKTAVLLFALAFPLALFAQAQAKTPPAQPASPVTEISADLGPCTVEFHVTDLAGNPLYNAKIRTTIRHGFMSKRKVELEAGTNADGRARFVKLPAQLKKPLEFVVLYQDQTASYSIDPGTDCHAQRDVPLKVEKAATAK